MSNARALRFLLSEVEEMVEALRSGLYFTAARAAYGIAVASAAAAEVETNPEHRDAFEAAMTVCDAVFALSVPYESGARPGRALTEGYWRRIEEGLELIEGLTRNQR